METTENQKKIRFNIDVVGDCYVGKSAIIKYFQDGYYTPSFITTLGKIFYVKTISINGKLIKLRIRDTPGSNGFVDIVKEQCKNSHGSFIVYDISKKESFESVDNWFKIIKENAPQNCVIILLGNKSDLEEKRVIQLEEGKNKADELEISFYEISAKKGEFINDAFDEIVQRIFEKREEEEEEDEEEEEIEKEKGKKDRCCCC